MADLAVPYVLETQQRIVLSRLMHSGMSFDEICQVMCVAKRPDGKDGFKMTIPAVRAMMEKVYAQWNAEDANWQERARPAARRRILNHIRGAIQDKKWNAVANFEKTLARIEGTEYDDAAPAAESVVLTEAMKQVMGELDAEEIEELIQGESELLRAHAAMPVNGIIQVVADDE